MENVIGNSRKNNYHTQVAFVLIMVLSLLFSNLCISQIIERSILNPFTKPTADEMLYVGLDHLARSEFDAAFRSFTRASELNSPDASFHLACFYTGEFGVVQQDYDRFVQLVTKSAELNSVLGCYTLANILLEEKNEAKAIELFEKTVLLVERDSDLINNKSHDLITTEINKLKISCKDQSNIFIGKMYLDGIGVDKDLNKAKQHLTQLAEAGNAEAQYLMGQIYFNHKKYQTAAYWLNKAIAANNPSAYTTLGYMYHYGYGVDQDSNKAHDYYESAINLDSTAYKAMNNIGVLYDESLDYKTARYWYIKAINTAESLGTNCGMAERNLGVLYEHGYGVEKNDSIAMSLYQKALNHSTTNALDNLTNLSSKNNQTYSIFDGIPIHEKCIALIVGNSDYQYSPLQNPANDADAMYHKLSSAGIETSILSVNDDSKTLLAKIQRFFKDAENYDVALFYYSGHGAQKDGINYLLPIDVDINSNNFDHFISINEILVTLSKVGVKKQIIILDACRTYNIEKRAKAFAIKGLCNMKNTTGIPRGTFVIYSTRTNETADDGPDENNSPFTTVLLEELTKSQIDIRTIANNVRKEVFNRTKGGQQPSFDDEMIGNFYFNIKQ